MKKFKVLMCLVLIGLIANFSLANIASAATGSITATKVESTTYLGKTTITWTSEGATSPAVYVRVNLGTEKLMALGISGQENAAWIQLGHVYEFSLYTDIDKTALLDTVQVYVPALNNSIGSSQIKEVSMSKVTGLSAALAAASQATVYGGYAVVAISGGEYASPITAIADLADWCGTPSASNQCLIKIMPGSYNLGGAMLSLPSYVSMSGSGQAATKLSEGNIEFSSGSLDPSATNDLTDITLENITVNPPENGLISNVTILADQAVYPAYRYGSIYADNSAENLTLDNVTISVKNCSDGWYGIYLNTQASVNPRVKINNLHVVLDNITNTGYHPIGVYLYGGNYVVTNSSVETIGGGLALRLVYTHVGAIPAPDLIMNTTLNSPTVLDDVMGNGDNCKCANVYDVQSGYTLLPPTCK